MIRPILIPPTSTHGPAARISQQAFVPNVSGDSTTLNRSLPFTLASAGTAWTSDVIHVAGFRSFMCTLQVSSGTVKFKVLIIHPRDASTVVSEDTFGSYAVADGRISIGWAALAGNGGGGGGPLNVGGMDGKLYTFMQIKIEASGAAATVSVFDGLWLSST